MRGNGAPASVVAAYIARMNKEGAYRRVAAVGLVRLVVLATSTPFLASVAGASGVALAFLVANIVSLAVVLPSFKDVIPQLAVLWLTQSAMSLAVTSAGVGGGEGLASLPPLFLSGIIATLAIGHVTGVAKLGFILNTIKSALRSILT